MWFVFLQSYIFRCLVFSRATFRHIYETVPCGRSVKPQMELILQDDERHDVGWLIYAASGWLKKGYDLEMIKNVSQSTNARIRCAVQAMK